MPVFFVPPEQVTPSTVTISGDLLRHVRDSLRIHVGEELLLGDGAGRRYRTVVETLSKQALTARILETQCEPARQAPALVLGQALLKGDKMDWVIQKASELGVSRIAPLQTRQSIVQPKAGRIEIQTARWQRIALEAAQQSEQWHVAVVTAPQSLSLYLTTEPPSTSRLILTERRESAGSLRELELPVSPEARIVLLVGPEGGWATEELAMAEKEDWKPVTLGPTILRAETAAIVAIGIVQHRLGNLG
jgi:16S rRNA (uracil1498-N3)-methyltransferase